ncbi:MAG: phosphate acetyltransferase [Candidatus Omnitrophota bacterium]
MSIVDKDILKTIREKAKKVKARIVLPEALEPRILNAAAIIHREGIAQLILLGKKELIEEKARTLSLSIEGITIIDHLDDAYITEYTEGYYALRKHKGITIDEAQNTLKNPVYFAAMMVRNQRADGFVAGASFTTHDVGRAAIHCLGIARGIETVSSAFIMIVPIDERKSRLLIFADCGIVPDPTAGKLVDIAKSASRLLADLFDIPPKVALLSYSTKGSGVGDSVNKVREATNILKQEEPSLMVDGELQADAALDEKVAMIKAPATVIKGDANILIFPNLDAGNIAYKLIQRLACADALGPLLLGLNFPASDLSRGCSVNEIVDIVSVTSLRCGCKRC